MNNKTYTPLWIHSEYSLLESTIKIENLVSKAAQLGFESIAITDKHNLFGAMKFCMACKKKGIKPIIGCQVLMEDGNEILLYCKNHAGYENLSYMLTESYMHSNENKISWENLDSHADGLICIASPDLLRDQDPSTLAYIADQLQGKIEWYVGLSIHSVDESAHMSAIHDTAVVAVSETYFLNPEDQEAHDVLLCIKNKNYISEENRIRSDARFCLMTPTKAAADFAEMDFALKNTIMIANKCNFTLAETAPYLPSFHSPEFPNMTEIEVLSKMANEGLRTLLLTPDERAKYQTRLDFELGVIGRMGFAGYFLIVADFVNFARSQDIPVSMRGSGAGSLVARCINITDIDPIKFELFFERFLNPGRVSMPDFDVDFSPTGRGKTIEYVIKKYGADSVSGIITFGSLSSRMVLKDVGRVLQVPYSKTDNLSKKVQVLFGKVFTLQQTYDQDPEFSQLIDDDETLKKVFEIGKQLEGLGRHISAHAAGIIITDRPLYKIAPLYKDTNSELPLVQFSMKYAEASGLVKFDFLGVTALDIIAQTIQLIKAHGHQITLPMDDFSDPKVYELMRSGFTKGIFQFETPGMTRVIHNMGADSIEDLIATVALYRPGPMDNIPMFIKRKKGEEKEQHIYPQLEEILANTYGIIVYQEQVLRIAQDIAGYSLAEADLLRRAIGKKIASEMAQQKQEFVSRAHKIQGGDIQKAEDLFKLIETFANYGFNKAHAAAYAIVGYKGGYLKAYYPLYFMCVSMTAELHNTEKLVELVLEARKMGIKVVGPDVNSSGVKFEVNDKGEIVYGLAAIKNIGEHLAAQIVSARPFVSLDDLVSRVTLNKREVESLIMSGALDFLGQNRGVLWEKYQNLPKDAKMIQWAWIVPETINEAAAWDYNRCLDEEHKVLGMYLSGHPLNRYYPKKLGLKEISDLDLNENKPEMQNACVLQSFKQKFGRGNNRFYICYMSETYGSWSGIVNDEEMFERLPNLIGKPVWCTVQIRNGRAIIRNIRPIEDKIKLVHDLHVKIESQSQLVALKSAVSEFKSDEGVGLYIHTDEVVFGGYINNIISVVENLGDGFKWYVK